MEKLPSSKLFLHISGGLLCLVLAIVASFGAMRPWYNNIRAEVTNQPYARTVSVTAEGKVTIKPDVGVISLSVVTQGASVKQVTNDGNVRMNQVIQAVKNLGVDAKDIRTTQYSLYPQQTWDSKQAPSIVGYMLTQEISVKVRKLETVDDVLDGGIKAGANQVGQLSFELDDPSVVKNEARRIAFDTARQKAEDMAKSAHVSIGRVVTFSEDNYQPPVMYANFAYDRGVAAPQAAPAPSIEPGTQDMTINVSVTYEIE